MVDFFRRFGFTKRDLVLISFLLTTLVAGLIVREVGWKNPKSTGHSVPNSEFEQHLNSAFSTLELNEKQQEKANLMRQYSDSLLDEKERNTTLKNGEIPSKKIDINHAMTGDLQLLPGIGEVTAERIIEYRERTGGFKSIDEIMNVKGIGAKKFEKMKNLITVN